MSLSPDQLEQRRLGITATDMAAILGHNPWRSAIDVWREKRGDAEPFTGNVRTKWGQLLEPVIRSDYEERHGVRVEVPGTLEHPNHEWWKASPDGLVYRPGDHDPERGLEIKVHTFRVGHHYGAPGTDEVPLWELIQCVWNMGCVPSAQRWDLVPFIDGVPTEYTIERDEELIGMLRERAERFHVDNVLGGVVPDPNGSEHDGKVLAKVWAKNNGELIDIGNRLDVFDQVEKARELRTRIAEDEDHLERIEQALKATIADAAGLTWKNANGKAEKISWKHNKPQRWIDFPGILQDVRAAAALCVSGTRKDVDGALEALNKIGGHVGSSNLSGIAIAKLIESMRSTLMEVIKAPTTEERTKHYTNRPFNYPKTWKAPKAKEEHGK